MVSQGAPVWGHSYFLTGSLEKTNTQMAAEAYSSYSLKLVSSGEGIKMNSVRIVENMGRAKIYPLGLWVISTSASIRICWKEEDREYIKPSVSLLQYTVGLEQRLLCLLVHHSYLTLRDGRLSIVKRHLRQVTFSRSPSKFIFFNKGGIAVCKRCAHKTFSFHQSLCSVPQHELRHGHQLSLFVWAGFRFEPSLFSSQPRLIPSLSVAAQHRPSLSNTVRHLKVRMVNGVFRLKGELESSASMMVLVCLLGTCANGVGERHSRGKNRKAKCVYGNKHIQQTWICERMHTRGAV